MKVGSLVEISSAGRKKKWIQTGYSNILDHVGIVTSFTRDGFAKVFWPDTGVICHYTRDLRASKRKDQTK